MAEQMTLTVSGMTCGGCENAVTRVLSTIDGVSNVSASHRDNRVTLEYDPARADRARIAKAIEGAGYRFQLNSCQFKVVMNARVRMRAARFNESIAVPNAF